MSTWHTRRVGVLVVVWVDAELEPCPTRQFHLGAQQEQLVLSEVFHTPEIDYVVDPQVAGASSAA